MGLRDLFNKSKKKNEDQDIEEQRIYYNNKTFILSRESDINKLMSVLCSYFNVKDAVSNMTAIEVHNRDIEISIQMLSQSMSEKSDEFIKGQKNSICGHFYSVETEYTDIKTNLLYAIDMAKSMIAINYSFIEDETDKNTFVEETFGGLLNDLQGVMLVMGEEEDCIYCQSDNDGKVMDLILSDKGRSDLSHYVPDDPFEMTTENTDLSGEQIERRKKSRKVLEDKHIFVPAWYPVIESEEEAHCRSAKEIAERTVALLIVSLYSECRLAENMSYEDAYKFVKDIIEQYDADKMFSPKERAYLDNPDSTVQEQTQYSWQYENLFVMEWALGLVDGLDKLDYPDHICDVPLTVQLLNELSSVDEILEKADPKSNSELLDECDLIFCLDWACVDTRVHGLPSPAGLDSGVVVERHKALNWLVGADENADWDDVGTNT